MADGSRGEAADGGAWQPSRDDHCYRHRDRLSFVICQRCGRTVCGECQTAAPVGVVCPGCMKADRRGAPKLRGAAAGGARGAAARFGGGTATMWTVGAIAAVSIIQLLVGLTGRDPIGAALEFQPIHAVLGGGLLEPWRVLSYALVHGSLLHLAFNLLTLWFFGRAVEAEIGRRRFLLLFLASVLAGAVAVTALAPYSAVIGASAGVFGLMAAAFFVIRRQGGSTRTLLVLIAINVVFGFIGTGVSWQAHLGGLAAGALTSWLLLRDADRSGAKAGRHEAIAWGVAVALLLAPFLIALVMYRATMSLGG